MDVSVLESVYLILMCIVRACECEHIVAAECFAFDVGGEFLFVCFMNESTSKMVSVALRFTFYHHAAKRMAHKFSICEVKKYWSEFTWAQNRGPLCVFWTGAYCIVWMTLAYVAPHLEMTSQLVPIVCIDFVLHNVWPEARKLHLVSGAVCITCLNGCGRVLWQGARETLHGESFRHSSADCSSL